MSVDKTCLALKYLGPADYAIHTPKTIYDRLSLIVANVAMTIFRAINWARTGAWYNNQSAKELIVQYLLGTKTTEIGLIKRLYEELRLRQSDNKHSYADGIDTGTLNKLYGVSGFINLPYDLHELILSTLSCNPGINRRLQAISFPVSLDFRKKPIRFPEFEKEIIKNTSNIKSIHLPQDATDEYLILLTKHCPNLEILNLARCTQITSNSMQQHLSSFTQLKSLDLSSLEYTLTDSILKTVASLSQLESLNISIFDNYARITNVGYTKTTNVGISHLSSLTKLKKFKCNGRKINEVALISLTNIKPLRSLSVKGWIISASGLQTISQLTELQSLSLNLYCPSQRITDDDFQNLTQLTKLKKLSLTYCHSITTKGFSHLSIFSELQILKINYFIQSADSLIAPILQLKKLQKLKLTASLEEDSFRQLRELKQLQKLSLDYQGFSDNDSFMDFDWELPYVGRSFNSQEGLLNLYNHESKKITDGDHFVMDEHWLLNHLNQCQQYNISERAIQSLIESNKAERTTVMSLIGKYFSDRNMELQLSLGRMGDIICDTEYSVPDQALG